MDPADAVFAPLIARRVGLVGFGPQEEDRLSALLSAAGSACHSYHARAFPLALRRCDVVLAMLDGLQPLPDANFPRPVIAALTPDSLQRYSHWIKGAPIDWYFFPGSPDEVLARVTVALQRQNIPKRIRTGRAFCVLLADDDPMYHELFRWMFHNQAMVFRAVIDGPKALEVARNWQPDLVLLDVNMPGMDGFEVLAALKRNEETKEIPILMVTGDNQDSGILRGLRLGAKDYVVKPFDVPSTLERIRQIRAEAAV